MICNCRHTKKGIQLFSSQYSLHWWVTPTAYYISRSYVGQQYWQSRPKIQFRLEYKVGNLNTLLIFSFSISFASVKSLLTEMTEGCFIYILHSSNSSLFTFWSSSRRYWIKIWTGNSNGSWTDKQSSHISTAKEISVKSSFFFIKKWQQTTFEMMLKWCWISPELVICKWWTDYSHYSRIELVDGREYQKI